MSESSFLAEKYADLSGSKPVERAVQKTLNEGAPGAKTKEDRVDRYIARLERVAFSTNERGERRFGIIGKAFSRR